MQASVFSGGFQCISKPTFMHCFPWIFLPLLDCWFAVAGYLLNVVFAKLFASPIQLNFFDSLLCDGSDLYVSLPARERFFMFVCVCVCFYARIWIGVRAVELCDFVTFLWPFGMHCIASVCTNIYQSIN